MLTQELPLKVRDAADAVNLLLQAGELPPDIHYAVLTSKDDKLRFQLKAGAHISHLPARFMQEGKIWVVLWQEPPPFRGLGLHPPEELIAAAVRHYNQGNPLAPKRNKKHGAW